MMPSVWQTVSKKTGQVHPRWRFWYQDYRGRRRYGTGTRDYEQTTKLAIVLEEEHREIKLGLRPIPAENKATHSLDKVRDGYLEWGKLQGGRRGHGWSPTHLRNKRSRLVWWEAELGLETLGDLHGCLAKVERSLARLREEGRSSKTVAEYGDALYSFCTWCVNREYLPENPLKHLQRMATAPEEIRRALTREEIARLLEVATPERQLLYLMALVTGLRAKELASLRKKHLDMKHGGVLLEPEWTKNRKPGFIALPDVLLKELKGQRGAKHAPHPLLQVPTHTARMLDRDLQAAAIPKNTDEGKVDFHAFRTTFTTLVLESGANPKEAQELARHSTPGLTMNTYARARNGRLAEITDSVAQSIWLEDKSADPSSS